MNRTKLPIRERIGNVPQFPIGVDVAVAEKKAQELKDQSIEDGKQARVENSVTRNWSSMILEVIRRKVMTKDDKYNSDYVPEYRTYTGQEMKMKKGAAVLQVFLNSPQLSFSSDHEDVNLIYMLIGDLEISKRSISKLRSAIYQLGEDTEEKKELNKKLVKVLRDKEEERLKTFLETTISYLKILK
ncbi:hypothetical protein AgCh_031116 [Apium graveolens]